MTSISTNPASGLISSPGLGSGLDVNTLVGQLVAAERKPAQNRIDSQRAEIKTQTSAIGALKSLLSALQGSLSSLTDGSAFGKRIATSSDEELFTATADAQAVPGSYQIEVLGMAAAQKLTSTGFASDAAVGTGTLTLAMGGKSVAIEIDADNNSLAGIRDAINAAPGNPGISASIVHAEDGDHLVLSADATGVEHAFSVSASGGDGGLAALTWDSTTATGSLALQTEATDARIKVDGFVATSASNVVDGAIEGVSLDIAKAEPGQVESLTVTRDTTSMENLVKIFVSAYNNYIGGAQKLAGYDADTKTAGPLLGDATLSGIRSQLSSVLADTAGDDATGLRTLGEIGIRLQADGTLELDADTLSDALETQSAEVANLFAGDNGYGTRLDQLLDGYLGSGGLLDLRGNGLDARSKQLDDQQTRLDARMQSVQNRYLAQFTALDTMMAQMNQTSSFLSSQLASLAAITQPKNK